MHSLIPLAALAMPLTTAAVAAAPLAAQSPVSVTVSGQDTLVASATGFSGPEAVRYDPEQDVYFVANFNGSGDAADNNGFISRLRADGKVEALRFIAGGAKGVTLHAPRGMFIVGDTLWAADVDAVRGFDRHSGAPIATVDFTALEPGFLNDVAAGPDGVLYVTDTPKHRIYRIVGRRPSVAVEDTTLGRPNGITWDASGNRFIVVPYGGRQALFGWRPGQGGLEVLGDGRILVASQADSSLLLVDRGRPRRVARTVGAPADIGLDRKRELVAVPYIALDRVDIFRLVGDR
jgi:DNA-binding beta-propeller fold protein YncE